MTVKHKRPLSDAQARAALNAWHTSLREDFWGFEASVMLQCTPVAATAIDASTNDASRTHA